MRSETFSQVRRPRIQHLFLAATLVFMLFRIHSVRELILPSAELSQPTPTQVQRSKPIVIGWPAESIGAWSELAVQRQLFDRPAPSRLAASTPPTGLPIPIRPSPVVLGFHGVIGSGSSAVALINGFPGREGTTLVSTDDTAGGFRVLRIFPDSVVLRSADSIVRLTLQQPKS